MNDILTDFNELSSILAGAYAVVALLMTLLLSYFHKRDLPVKLLGSLMVLSIMFGANNAWIYAIGVFIVATLVTELQFLEKLAALAWNRKEYWQYLSQASDEEIKAKYIEDAQEEVTKIESAYDNKPESPLDKSTRKIGKLIEEAHAFENNVLKALESKKFSLFLTSNFSKHIKLNAGSRTIIIDAIAMSRERHFLIEIKHYKNEHSITHATYKIKSTANEYNKYLQERGKNLVVTPVLVVPQITNETVVEEIPILRFDNDSKTFTNIQDFTSILRYSKED
ncbi:NERD domain-containing protein [Rhodohalobacter sp. 8-1]|uniref:NERD domain-containing protein n=1 Tax=Rhodohalobacter sp. 8-1 TaxID=3131972 RepID=UPI0030EF49A7